MSVMACVGPNGTTTKTVNAASTTMNGAIQKTKPVGFGGHDVFFKQQLDGVSNGLQQSVRAHAHGAEPDLHVRENLALQPVHRDHRNGKAEEDKRGCRRRPRTYSRGAGRLVAGEVGLDVSIIERISGPPRREQCRACRSRRSRRPPAGPRHITSSACRFTNDGGRTRTR